MAFLFGIFIGTVSNYLHHVKSSSFDCLFDYALAQILWSSFEGRAIMQGLVFGFPECVAFVDGTKQYFFRPKDNNLQEERLSVDHHELCSFMLLRTDMYCEIIRAYITLDGSAQEGHLYTESEP